MINCVNFNDKMSFIYYLVLLFVVVSGVVEWV
jgi:hypothetical protein